MKKEFIIYLEAIGITEALRERIEKIYEFCVGVCPGDIVDIFVDEYIKEDGTREYQGITFFSDKYTISARQFLTKDDFILTPIKKKVLFSEIKKQDYDFKKAAEKSKLHLRIVLDTGIDGDFKASRENCDYLRGILLKYIIPNLKE